MVDITSNDAEVVIEADVDEGMNADEPGEDEPEDKMDSEP